MKNLSFKEKRQMMKQWKFKRTSIIAIAFFLFIIPVIALLYTPYLYYIDNPKSISNVLAEAKTIDRSAIENNEKLISEYVKKIEATKNSSDLSKEAVLLEENNPYSLSNEEAKKIYSQIGITYDFNDVESIRTIPSKVKLNRNLLKGQIIISEVDMNLPVLEGVSKENLYIGASTMKPNQKLGRGNYALAGHLMPDSDTLFSPLKEVSKGMTIYISDMSIVYTYKITGIEEVSSSDKDIISDEAGEGILTLVTSSKKEAEKCLIIQAELINEENINVVDQELYNKFME